MKLARVSSATVWGITGQPVDVEVQVAAGLPGFTVVGLPDTSCREARDRVRAALLSAGMKWPMSRITVNLAPSSVRKIGSGLDLAIAIGVLIASDQVSEDVAQHRTFVGELGLDGTLRTVPGVVPAVLSRKPAEGVVAEEALKEFAGLHCQAVGFRGLGDLFEAARTNQWPVATKNVTPVRSTSHNDLNEVAGQHVAKFAIEIAAAGGHHLLMSGPPGSGKSMLAARLPSVLPPIGHHQAEEVCAIYSAAGATAPVFGDTPFRSPHHSATLAGMLGGGSHQLRPGEVTLAHHGVLFLDELGEFSPHVLDGLRQPLGEQCVHVVRSIGQTTMPAHFQLVATTNPCPCGFYPTSRCVCTESAFQRYQRRLSGPLLDRFDLRVEVTQASSQELFAEFGGESSVAVAGRVQRARDKALQRWGVLNAAAPASRQAYDLSDNVESLLRQALDSGRLSGRGLHKILKVSRTIADLTSEQNMIEEQHVRAAMGFRLDRYSTEGIAA